ncbi:MAG: hypothetical protein D6679_03125 [Candidatus Hydrogenedentota bacterium]|nr:MAG: hypothetical protein D6679_03125 [Candidatus Hydrogenedentota bacterium]
MTEDAEGLAEEKHHLGTLLLRAGVITSEQLDRALEKVKKSGRRLGEVLVGDGIVSEERIQNFLSIQMGIPPVQLENTFIDPAVARSIPEKFARRYGVIPLYRSETTEGQVVVVAMADPANLLIQDELRKALKSEIFATLARQSEMDRFLEKVWSPPPAGEEEAEGDTEEGAGEEALRSLSVSVESAEEKKPSIARILETIFNRALDLSATAVHLEPKKKFVVVRYRVDGVYHSVTSLPREAYAAVVARLKLLSKIPVGEGTHELLEGRFHLRPDLALPPIDIRTTIIPAAFGEKAVLKITRRDEVIRPLEELGFEEQQRETLDRILKHPGGLLLISGKNDSGKTTLAYSILSAIGDASKMIVTLEDPPAYPVSAFNQISKAVPRGATAFPWNDVLRSVERQEPDIVFLSAATTAEEMRVLLHLAATGRFVLGSIYADDAVSSYWVPLQLGMDSFALASVLTGMIHCRLMRTICRNCVVRRKPTPEQIVDLGLKDEDLEREFLAGEGCEQCMGTGYRSRTGVFEVVTIPDHLKEMIESRAPSDVFRSAARDAGLITLRQAALAKARRGLVSLDEVIRRTSLRP